MGLLAPLYNLRIKTSDLILFDLTSYYEKGNRGNGGNSTGKFRHYRFFSVKTQGSWGICRVEGVGMRAGCCVFGCLC
jgi:hypothetical protein